jgi:hypothetical protein
LGFLAKGEKQKGEKLTRIKVFAIKLMRVGRTVNEICFEELLNANLINLSINTMRMH